MILEAPNLIELNACCMGHFTQQWLNQHTLLNKVCSDSWPFFTFRPLSSSSRRSLSILKNCEHLHEKSVQGIIYRARKHQKRECLKMEMEFEFFVHLRWTSLMKCWGGINARSMSTRATTIFLASARYSSKAECAIATICINHFTLIHRTFKPKGRLFSLIKNLLLFVPRASMEDTCPIRVWHLQHPKRCQRGYGEPELQRNALFTERNSILHHRNGSIEWKRFKPHLHRILLDPSPVLRISEWATSALSQEIRGKVDIHQLPEQAETLSEFMSSKTTFRWGQSLYRERALHELVNILKKFTIIAHLYKRTSDRCLVYLQTQD